MVIPNMKVEPKNPDRALQKIARAYQMEFQKLLDVARSTVLFDSVEDLVRCLELIEGEARILRIKNRLDPSYDAGPGGGYRDVSMNLEWPRPGHTRGHVVELQLNVQDIFELKKGGGGHKRYVAFRDMRGD